jgi:hypothetical protein
VAPPGMRFLTLNNIVDGALNNSIKPRDLPVEYKRLMDPFAQTFVIVDVVLMFLSIAGGGSLFCVIARFSSRLRSSYTVLVISLLMSDVLTGALVIPLHLSLVTDGRFSNPYLCKFYRYISSTLSTAGIYSTFLLVLDTFYVVGYQVRNSFKQGICVFSLSFVWFFSLSYSIWSLVVYIPVTHFDPVDNTTIWLCGLSETFSTYAHILVLTDFFVILALPVLLTSILFTMILSLIRSNPRKEGDLDLIKLTSVLVIIHVITYLPVQILKFCDLSSCTPRMHVVQDLMAKELSELTPFFRGPLSYMALPALHRDTRDAIMDICRKPDECPNGRSRTDRSSGASIEIRLLDAGL